MEYVTSMHLLQLQALIFQDASDSDEDEANESTGDDEASYMMVDPPAASLPNSNPAQFQKNEGIQEQMAEVEDGWTVVPSRKSKGRKN